LNSTLVIKLAALVIGCGWLIILIGDWMVFTDAHNQLKNGPFFNSQAATILDQAKNILVIKTIFAGVLCLFGLLYKKKVSKTEPNPDTHVKCPDCRELVLKEASVCKHCGCKLIPQ